MLLSFKHFSLYTLPDLTERPMYENHILIRALLSSLQVKDSIFNIQQNLSKSSTGFFPLALSTPQILLVDTINLKQENSKNKSV